MLFPFEAVLKAREELAHEFGSDKAPAPAKLEKLLAADPDFGPAILALAYQRVQAGDPAAAEQFLRRGMSAHPCDYKFPMTLSRVVLARNGNEALGQALLELAGAKLLADPDELEHALKAGGLPPEITDAGLLQDLVNGLNAARTTEPAEVTEYLRVYRRIHDVQEALGNELDRELVEEILKDGEASRPLLIGILRGLAEGYLPDGGELIGEAALAMLGEIADPRSLPALVQFAVVDDNGLSETAAWALQRSAQLRPAETLAQLRDFDRRMGGAERACMAETIATMPDTPGKADALLALFENFGVTLQEERTDIFVMISAAMLHCLGKAAPPLIRSALKDLAGVLPKEASKAADELLRAWTADPSLFENPPETRSTVFDICCSDRMSDYEEEEEGEEGEHVHGPGCNHSHAAPPPPGRNDPCWCGSGKKYKKCHLADDEEAKRNVAAEE